MVAVDRVDRQECTWNVPVSTAMEEACTEVGGGIPDTQILRPSALVNLLGSEQVVGTCFLRVGDCNGMLAATVEGIPDGE